MFLDGKVLLYDQRDRWASAVAIDDGAIVRVGRDRDVRKLVGPRTRVIDLDGKMLMPGMVDGHAHGSGFVVCNLGYTGGTIDEVLGKLKACLLRTDQAPLLKTNSRLTASNIYLQSLLPPGTRLTRDVLDGSAPRPRTMSSARARRAHRGPRLGRARVLDEQPGDRQRRHHRGHPGPA